MIATAVSDGSFSQPQVPWRFRDVLDGRMGLANPAQSKMSDILLFLQSFRFWHAMAQPIEKSRSLRKPFLIEIDISVSNQNRRPNILCPFHFPL